MPLISYHVGSLVSQITICKMRHWQEAHLSHTRINSSHEHISFCAFGESLRSQINEEVSSHLKDASVAIKDYQEVTNDIKTLSASGKKLWIDPAKAVPYPPPPSWPIEHSVYFQRLLLSRSLS